MKAKEIITRLIISLVLLIVNYFISLLEIPVLNGSLIFRFGFIINMIYAVYFNSWWCAVFAAFGDMLPFLISPPSYSFFPGYTLSAVASILIYRYFLYRGDIDMRDAICAKLCVNMSINIVVGAIWRYILFGNNVYYYGAALVKNIALAPIEGAIFFGLYQVVEYVIRKKKNEGNEG